MKIKKNKQELEETRLRESKHQTGNNEYTYNNNMKIKNKEELQETRLKTIPQEDKHKFSSNSALGQEKEGKERMRKERMKQIGLEKKERTSDSIQGRNDE